MLGGDEMWLNIIQDDMEPDDECPGVCDTNDATTPALTSFGNDSLKELMPNYRRQDNEGGSPIHRRHGSHLMNTNKWHMTPELN